MHGLPVRCYRAVCGLGIAAALLAAGNIRAQGVPGGSTHSVALTWQAPSPAGGSGTISGYNVYRSPSSTTNYAKLNTSVTAGLTYTDSNVSAGTSYNYCVTAVDSSGEESACSVPATANVPSNPNAPSGLAITIK
jgi:fibronectin type 3 domain-containing protein